MISCTVKITFNAAKRLMDYQGKCHQLHGYRHQVEVAFVGDQEKALTVDFYVLKAGLSGWINAHWDHNVLLHQEDKKLGEAIRAITGQKIFYCEQDPTAEHLAWCLKEKVCKELFPQVRCLSVRLYDDNDAWVEVA